MNILNKVTLQVLRKNKVRTLVTIVGIILSAAMFTAVTTTVSSMRQYMINIVKANEGSWYGVLRNLTLEQLENVKQDERLVDCAVLKHIGYSEEIMENGQLGSKPYLYTLALEDTEQTMIPVRLVEGRLPGNSNEIILPKVLRTSAGIETSLGELLTLDVGRRQYDGKERYQSNSYIYKSSGQDTEEVGDKELDQGESYVRLGERQYTVVGYFENLSIEWHSPAAYVALTAADDTEDSLYDVYFTLSEVNDTYTFLEEHSSGDGAENIECSANKELIRYLGARMGNSYMMVLYSLAAILIAIIVFGSIALIYNAFSISVGERTKQFAILKSVGATNRQVRQSVIFEGVMLSLIGIPLGVLGGLLGIGITLRALSGSFGRIFGAQEAIELTLSVSAPAIIIAVLICIATVLISASIPAKRAVKQQPIAVIRQSTEIKLAPKSVKTNSLVLKVFGFSGMLADKNFKRNKRRYRATVFSLFVSIVLFISASSFCTYLTDGARTVMSGSKFDLRYYLMEENEIGGDELIQKFRATQGVNEAVYATPLVRVIFVPSEVVSEEAKKVKQSEVEYAFAGEMDLCEAILWFVEDDYYRDYLQNNGLDTSLYMNAENPVGLMGDNVKLYNGNEERYYALQLFNRESMTAYSTDSLYNLFEWDTEDQYQEMISAMTPEALRENENVSELTIGGRYKEPIFFLSEYGEGVVNLLYPYSAMETLVPDASFMLDIYMRVDDHAATADRISSLLESNFLSTARLTDYAEVAENSRALILVINVFSYGFIVLISLIAVANVFNTISTNVSLRRRELAMLRSVGMTKKSMRHMMNFECLLYGFKSLIYGLPVSFCMTYQIYKSINYGLEIQFFVPWYSVAIAVGSVFVVVFATMMYSMRKINRHNTIDELRNENL